MHLLRRKRSLGDCDRAAYKEGYNKRTEMGLRMEDVGGMVHTFLKGTVKVGKCFRTASKTKAFTQIVAAFGAICATIAHDTSLDGDSLAEN
jgi:hypothetical protein